MNSKNSKNSKNGLNSQNSSRKNPLYGNYSVFSPDGKLMFRCSSKRANWYLSRNLATANSENSNHIYLTFVPKGYGESCEALKKERWNKCAVCGCEEIEKLTKHHIIPKLFRKFFPEKLKSHRSFFNIPICRECHNLYENTYLPEIKSQFMTSEENKDREILKDFRKIDASANAILNDSRIPVDKKQLLLNMLVTLCAKHKIPFDKNDISNSLSNILKENYYKNLTNANFEAKLVVERLIKEDKLLEFERIWVNHFIDRMKPSFLPEEIINTLASFKEVKS